MPLPDTAEHRRLIDSKARQADWKNWGPYVAERAWGTVREDYSADAEAWDYFPHKHARSRVYRWNEDGLAGYCNRFQNACMALALWNERDPILKERLFGLSGPQGNHGEDVKEAYYYLDSTPTHSYAKMLYRYPQVEYPYRTLIRQNARRSREQSEFELTDAIGDALAEGRYFDVVIEYAKLDDNDILCRITATNRAAETAPIHLLPHLWFRNIWSWGYARRKPRLWALPARDEASVVCSEHPHLGTRWWYVTANTATPPPLLFTENESNAELLWGVANATPFVKDAFHDAVVHDRLDRVNPEQRGTKVAAHLHAMVPAGQQTAAWVRYTTADIDRPFVDFEATFERRIAEADEFYETLHEPAMTADERRIQRQAYAGLMWTKQVYHYSVELWLDGDPTAPMPPAARQHGRNSSWRHLYNLDVISMPDKWEYPWYAAWDLAFQSVPIAWLDPEWAKRQLILLLREWYMHPNGQIPAYEWELGDVNPPVHAWAAWRVYKITRKLTGHADVEFLERIFHKLLLNFTWWVNRKDAQGRNVFQGGFLGLDNIGVFDRSAPLPGGGRIEQADGTAWMAMYCLNMMAIAVELAMHRSAYEDLASKFFEHFLYIGDALNAPSDDGGLWHETDGFYYDEVVSDGQQPQPLRLRSMVGLIPLLAVETLEPAVLDALPKFRRRLEWLLQYRPHLIDRVASLQQTGAGGRRLVSLVGKERLSRILSRMLDPAQFLSRYGIRSLSKEHEANPYQCDIGGNSYTVRYEPAESSSGLFGGNSNWRGPIWLPLNFLLIESLQRFHHYYGDTLKVEMPHGSGTELDLAQIAGDLSDRLIDLFRRGEDGRRPFNGDDPVANHPSWQDPLLFHEYFHGDDGRGLGASHQTGWTALVAKLLQQRARVRR